eukprot:ctg_296.g207
MVAKQRVRHGKGCDIESVMVNLVRGTLITDIPMKQFLLKLDQDEAPNRFHLLIHSWAVKLVEEKLEQLYLENQYQVEH